jgi:hypothetical protein
MGWPVMLCVHLWVGSACRKRRLFRRALLPKKAPPGCAAAGTARRRCVNARNHKNPKP